MVPIQPLQGPLGATHLQSLSTQEHERQLQANDSQPLSRKKDTLISGCENQSSCPAQLVGVWPSPSPDSQPNCPTKRHPGPVRCPQRRVSGNEAVSRVCPGSPLRMCNTSHKHWSTRLLAHGPLRIRTAGGQLEHQGRSNLVLRRPTWDLLSTPRLRGGSLELLLSKRLQLGASNLRRS